MSRIDDLEIDELRSQIQYLETWGKLYMWLYGITFLIVLVGLLIWVIEQ